MRSDEHTRDLLWLLLIAAVAIGAGIGLRDPWPADEPRFVLVARQMLDSGDWLFPHRGGELYADKPPLYFWLLALAERISGGWRGSFLLPSLLASLGTLALTFDFARRMWGGRAGTWAAGALLCCFQFLWQAKHAQIDPTLGFFVALGLYGLLRHLLLGPNWRWAWIGGFAAGAGVVAKGVGFLPLLVLVPYALMRRRGWSGLPAQPASQGARWILLALAFLLPIALWLLPLGLAVFAGEDPARHAYWRELLLHQTAGRYAAAWHHAQPPWYFAPVIAFAWLPFSVALPWLLAPWRAAWRARDARIGLPLAWAGLVLLFFSLSPGKRDMYILPMLPALALAAAPFLPALAERAGPRRSLAGVLGLLALALLGGGGWALWGEPGFELRLEAARGLAGGDDRHWWLAAALGLGMMVCLAAFGRQRLLAGAAAAQGILWLGLSLGGYPLLDGANSARDLMHRARAMAGKGVALGLVGWREQHLLQAPGPVVEFGYGAPLGAQWRAGARWLRADPARRRLFVLEEIAGTCVLPGRAARVGAANRRGWLLVGIEALRPGC